MDQKPALYGLMAEFDDPTALVAAARRTREAGYRKFDSYSPFPIHELFDAMDCHDRRVPLLVLLGGIAGGLTGFGLQAWVSAVAYPLNIGGRPMNSWPAFVVPTFETTILFAALSAVLGMFWLYGLPQPYHPVFNVPRFTEASRNRFFMMVLSRDPRFDLVETKRFLAGLKPLSLEEVPH